MKISPREIDEILQLSHIAIISRGEQAAAFKRAEQSSMIALLRTSQLLATNLQFCFPSCRFQACSQSSIVNLQSSIRLTQAQAAKILGIDQPRLTSLKNGRLGGFSIERLFIFLRKLDRDIEIVIRERPTDKPPAEISISAALCS